VSVEMVGSTHLERLDGSLRQAVARDECFED